ADRVRALLPELKRWIPADIDMAVMSDRTTTIRASLADMQKTLLISICLVMGVVLAFLGRLVPMVAAGLTIPLAFAGTFFGMWLAGFSVGKLLLMALGISVGFLFDDSIVVIQNMVDRLVDSPAPLPTCTQRGGQ